MRLNAFDNSFNARGQYKNRVLRCKQMDEDNASNRSWRSMKEYQYLPTRKRKLNAEELIKILGNLRTGSAQPKPTARPTSNVTQQPQLMSFKSMPPASFLPLASNSFQCNQSPPEIQWRFGVPLSLGNQTLNPPLAMAMQFPLTHVLLRDKLARTLSP